MRLLLALGFATACWAQDAPNLVRVDPPAAKVTLDEAIRGGVEFLVRNQNKSGSFGTRTNGRPYNVTSAVPGGHYAFEAATTAICWMGLRDVKHQTKASLECQQRALAWLVEHARVKRAHPGQLYNTWSFAYGLRALAQALREQNVGVPEKKLRAAAEAIVKAMETYQTPDGGWGYYDFRTRSYKPSWSTSFSTATSLIALRHAEQAGIPVPVKVLQKATGNLEICRKPDGTFLYGSYHKYAPMHRVNKPQGAAICVCRPATSGCGWSSATSRRRTSCPASRCSRSTSDSRSRACGVRSRTSRGTR
ncbi:MAG: hypothetical protein ACYTGN_12295 [Planctomycetota bacterium]|jgi:hypothetical protein